jgi:hypothetical protein
MRFLPFLLLSILERPPAMQREPDARPFAPVKKPREPSRQEISLWTVTTTGSPAKTSARTAPAKALEEAFSGELERLGKVWELRRMSHLSIKKPNAALSSLKLVEPKYTDTAIQRFASGEPQHAKYG